MNEKILIIDDEKDIVKFLSELLAREGFQVRNALRGEEAINIFKAEPFDLVITDIRMPGMNGLEVMKQIKAMDEDTEVIILTGFATFDTAIKALRDEGASDYLLKPLESTDELFIALNRALEKRRLRIENKALFNELKQSKENLENKVGKRTRDLEQANRELAESIKKLNCLFGISDLRQKNNLSSEEIIQSIVDIIPPAFQYPEICYARVVLEGEIFETRHSMADQHSQFENQKSDNQKISEIIIVNGNKIGKIEVIYLEERPDICHDPFQKEEKSLVTSISERLGRILEKKRSDEALRKAKNELEQRVKERTADLVIANRELEQAMETQKRTQKDLLKNQTMLQSVFDGIPDPLIMLYPDMSVKIVNKAAKAYYQISEEQDVTDGLSYKKLIEEPISCEEYDIASAISGSHAVTFERKSFTAPDKTEQVDIYPLREMEEKGAIIRISDITEAKLMAKLKEEKKIAEAANLAKSDFLANMSHELRTPLNAVIGFAEVLQDEYFGSLNEKQAEYINDILQGGKHLLGLINDILDISKVEAGKMDITPSPVLIKELLERSLIMIKEKAVKNGIHLSLDIPGDLDNLTIMADERKLKQIMFNLLSNAAKFTPKDGSISVEVRQAENTGHEKQKTGDWLEISVEDTGIGISPEDHENIFDEFYQVRNPTDEVRAGTGLGLSLARRFVEMHGGTMQVRSEGKGSRFSFVLPLNPEAREASMTKAENISAISIQDETVLSSYLNILIRLSGMSNRFFTLCRLHTEQKLSKEKAEEIGKTLQKIKREHDLLRIEQSSQLYLILKDTDYNRAKLTCDRLTKNLNSVVNGLDIHWSIATFPENARTPELLLNKVNNQITNEI
ncbi:ATP-binding protein [Desulfonema magnum]|nr:ATP-binding protein [Desulfonema magnum]